LAVEAGEGLVRYPPRVREASEVEAVTGKQQQVVVGGGILSSQDRKIAASVFC